MMQVADDAARGLLEHPGQDGVHGRGAAGQQELARETRGKAHMLEIGLVHAGGVVGETAGKMLHRKLLCFATFILRDESMDPNHN